MKGQVSRDKGTVGFFTHAFGDKGSTSQKYCKVK